MNVIETPRLVLRHLTWDDVEDLKAIYAAPMIMKFLPGTRSRQETKQKSIKICLI